MPAPIDPGEIVDVRGERWLLTHRASCHSGSILTLDGCDAANRDCRIKVVEAIDPPRRVIPPSLRRVSCRTAHRAAIHAVATARPTDRLWTAAAAAMDLWPYQLEPALAAISGASRLLLADAVGLGKTIQAGLILSELRARGWAEHALIVCPAGLRHAWAGELQSRFAITAWIADQPALAHRMAELPPGVNPWAGHGVIVASVDLVKRPEVMDALAAVPVDVLIADEAHHLTPRSDRAAAIQQLAARAPWCVLLTATPHSGDRDAFDTLTSMGRVQDRLTVFRRTRATAGVAIIRKTRALAARPFPDEQQLLHGVDAYARALWHTSEAPMTRLLATTLARRAASSPLAILRTLRRRAALLDGRATVDATQPALPWEEIDTSDALDSDAVLGTAGLDDAAEERRELQRLADIAEHVNGSAKLRMVARLLHRVREPAVVFTEYRDSLEAVDAALAAMRSVAHLHGGLSIRERLAAVDAFNTGAATVLLATDAGGEGLNLHHRCRLVINLELPWNPLRLEQRAGRVDRLGQRRVVHDVRIYYPRTIEHQVLGGLYRRATRAEHELLAVTHERDVAASIFGGTELPATAQLPASMAGDVAEAEAARIAEQRRFRQLAPHAATPGWSGRRRSGSLVVVARVAEGGVAGAATSTTVRAYHVRLNHQPSSPAEWRRALAQIVTRIAADSSREPVAGESMPVGSRISRIRDAIRTRTSSAYQDSLFDDRAAKDAERRATIVEALDRPLRRLDAALRSARDPHCRVEIIAAWPGRQP